MNKCCDALSLLAFYACMKPMRAVYHPRVQYPEPTPLETRRRVLRLPLIAAEKDSDVDRRGRRRRKFEQ